MSRTALGRFSEKPTTPTTAAPGRIGTSILRQTSNYLSKLRHGASQFLSAASHNRRAAGNNGNIFTRPAAAATAAQDLQDQQFQKHTLDESEQAFYNKWILLARAGSGGQFDVFFVIGRDWYESEAWRLVNRLNRGRKADQQFHFNQDRARRPGGKYVSLTEGVRVAKVPARRGRDFNVLTLSAEESHGGEANDFLVLRQLGDESKYTPHLVDYDRLRPNPAWVVQDAYNCSTLYTFSRAWLAWHSNSLPLPEAFIWHVFIDLTLALHYTHCAGVAHCDLVSFNICLHVPRRDFKTCRFPRVVPIDFGRAQRNQLMERSLCNWDLTRLGDLVHEMVHGIPFPTDGKHHALRDVDSGLCSCHVFALGADESRLSRRGQTLYRELMRYTAEASTKTINDVVAKLMDHAKIARHETYVPLPDGLLERISDKYFPSEETIWSKMVEAKN